MYVLCEGENRKIKSTSVKLIAEVSRRSWELNLEFLGLFFFHPLLICFSVTSRISAVNIVECCRLCLH